MQVEPSLPPGPRLPTWAQTCAFVFFPRQYVSWCRRRYGDIVTLGTAFDARFVMVFHPDLVRQVFQAPPERLRAGEANVLLGPALGERSVLLLDGAEHLRQRRLLLPPFHGARMLAYAETMRAVTDEAIDGWPVGEPFALLEAMRSLTLEVIMRTVFGVEDGARRAELSTSVRGLLEPLSGRRGLIMMALSQGSRTERGAMAGFRARRAALDELIHAELARRREEPDLESRADVMSMLLIARDEHGEGLTDGELRDQLVTLLVAGHETTATGLAWAFDRVLRSPRVRACLTESLAAGEERYLDATIKEALRSRPVVPAVGRVVRGVPFELGGYAIPEGTEINPSITTIHARADLYPNPHEFRPERFLDDDAPDTYTWLPFGGGTRRCLGASFALFEMRLVLARVLERAELEPVGERGEVALRRGVTIVPKHGVRVRMTGPPEQFTRDQGAGSTRAKCSVQ